MDYACCLLACSSLVDMRSISQYISIDTYDLSTIVLGSGNIGMSKTDKVPTLHKFTFLVGRDRKWILFIFLILLFFIFRERGREGEKEGAKHQCDRKKSTRCLPYVLSPGTKPITQACALTGNWTGDLSPCRTMPNQLRHTSGVKWTHFKWISKFRYCKCHEKN